MIAYGIGVLLLIKHLKVAYPDATQPWYTDYVIALGMFDNTGLYLNSF